MPDLRINAYNIEVDLHTRTVNKDIASFAVAMYEITPQMRHNYFINGLRNSMAHESYVSGNVMINYWERMRMPHEKELIKTRIIEISDFMDNYH